MDMVPRSERGFWNGARPCVTNPHAGAHPMAASGSTSGSKRCTAL